MANNIGKLYEEYVIDLIGKLKSEDFYNYFTNMLAAGKRNIYMHEKYIQKEIDLRWIEAIEKCLIPLDNIVRKPNKFIKNEEEIVPIALSRTISTEAVKHLATHTNLIASVEGDEIRPSKILNIYKEESYETYENRFIWTLLFQLDFFINKRLNILRNDNDAVGEFAVNFNGDAELGKDKLTYTLSMTLATPHDSLQTTDDLLSIDVKTLTPMERIERIRKIIGDYRGSQFGKAMANAPLVKPPLTMTNVLKKNPNFVACVELWQFINAYNEIGFVINAVEKDDEPSEAYFDNMNALLALEYIMLKQKSGGEVVAKEFTERRANVQVNLVKTQIKSILDTYTMDIEEIKQVFVDEYGVRKNRKRNQFNRIREIIKRALENEALEAKRRAKRIAEAKKAAEKKAKAKAKAAEKENQSITAYIAKLQKDIEAQTRALEKQKVEEFIKTLGEEDAKKARAILRAYYKPAKTIEPTVEEAVEQSTPITTPVEEKPAEPTKRASKNTKSLKERILENDLSEKKEVSTPLAKEEKPVKKTKVVRQPKPVMSLLTLKQLLEKKDAENGVGETKPQKKTVSKPLKETKPEPKPSKEPAKSAKATKPSTLKAKTNLKGDLKAKDSGAKSTEKVAAKEIKVAKPVKETKPTSKPVAKKPIETKPVEQKKTVATKKSSLTLKDQLEEKDNASKDVKEAETKLEPKKKQVQAKPRAKVETKKESSTPKEVKKQSKGVSKMETKASKPAKEENPKPKLEKPRKAAEHKPEAKPVEKKTKQSSSPLKSLKSRLEDLDSKKDEEAKSAKSKVKKG